MVYPIYIRYMNFTEACDFLDLSSDDLDKEKVHRQYRKMSLKYHPDKHREEDKARAAEQFRQLGDAKIILETYMDQEWDDELDMEDSFDSNDFDVVSHYRHQFTAFVEGLIGKQLQELVFHKFIGVCQIHALTLSRRMDHKLLQYIYWILERNREVWEVDEEFLRQVLDILHDKANTSTTFMASTVLRTSAYIIRPSLDDLFHDRVYTLAVGEEMFYVPLWVDEIEFVNAAGQTIQVQCQPCLPDGVTIDDDNHIHVLSSALLQRVGPELCFATSRPLLGDDGWEQVRGYLGGVTTLVTTTYYGCGIAIPNDLDMYDVSTRSDVYVYVT